MSSFLFRLTSLFGRVAGRHLLDSVGARVMALIVGTTFPLAFIAGVLAWHSYQATKAESLGRVATAASLVRGELIGDIARTQTALRIFLTTGIDRQDVPRVADMLETLSPGSYCVFALVEPGGHVVEFFEQKAASALICGGHHVEREEATRWLGVGANHAAPKISLLPDRQAPLMRIVSPVPYTDAKGARRDGTIVAIEALSIDALRALTDDAGEITQANAAEIWLVSPDVRPVALALSRAGERQWTDETLEHIHSDLGGGGRRDDFVAGGTYYSVVPLIGNVAIVARSVRSDAENHALNLFLTRVVLIGVLLAIELIAVAYAAHAYVVAPIERIAASVTNWRRSNVFRLAGRRGLPKEILHLERAFRRAIGRLDRHEERLRRAGRQQEALIREIHHRVKNNLQIVASLLNLQANRVREPEIREEFQLVRDRVRTLATLHRYLYPEGGIAALDIAGFLDELCGQIYLSHGMATTGRVKLRLDVAPLPIGPDQAVPIALLVNETVNNALRHAFPDERRGEIRVTLQSEGGRATIRVADDGIGLAGARAKAPPTRRAGIGIQLVRGFARQMHGEFRLGENSGGGGTVFEISFALMETPTAHSVFAGPPPLRRPSDRQAAGDMGAAGTPEIG